MRFSPWAASARPTTSASGAACGGRSRCGWSSLTLRYQPLGRVEPPGLFDQVLDLLSPYLRQPYQHVRVAHIMVGEEEALRIGRHQHLAGVEADLEHERFAVLPQPGDELAAHPQAGSAIARPLLHSWERQRDLADGVVGDRACHGSRIPETGPAHRHDFESIQLTCF